MSYQQASYLSSTYKSTNVTNVTETSGGTMWHNIQPGDAYDIRK